MSVIHLQMAFIMAPSRVTAVRLLAVSPDCKHAAVAELTSAKLMQACALVLETCFPNACALALAQCYTLRLAPWTVTGGARQALPRGTGSLQISDAPPTEASFFIGPEVGAVSAGGDPVSPGGRPREAGADHRQRRRPWQRHPRACFQVCRSLKELLRGAWAVGSRATQVPLAFQMLCCSRKTTEAPGGPTAAICI